MFLEGTIQSPIWVWVFQSCCKGFASEFDGLKQVCRGVSSSQRGSLYYQPKECTVIREIPQNGHRFVLFDSPKMGNLMTRAQRLFCCNNSSKGLSSLTAKSFAEALRFWPLGSKNCIFSSFPHIDPQNSDGIIATNQLRNAFLHSVAKNKAEMCDGARSTDFKIGRLKRLSKAPCS